MERNYDELISDILIQLDVIERRMEKVDTRLNLTIKRVVRIESQIESMSKKQDQSFIALQKFTAMQSKLNKYFLDYMDKNPIK